jgi:hypothetical protein
MTIGFRHNTDRTRGNTPRIDQPCINGWYITWNPDDARYYVAPNYDGVAAATFGGVRGWSNTVQWAKNHNPADCRN